MERILLVESNGAIAESLAGLLSEAGYDVTVASRAAEAKSILEENRADLLVTNAALPDGSALDLAYVADVHRARCLMYGADPARMAALLEPSHGVYMLEPLDEATVLEHVRRLLARAPRAAARTDR